MDTVGTVDAQPRLIICDFDNTLVESETVNANIFVEYFGESFGIAPDEEDRAIVDSAAFVEVIRHFTAKYPAELSNSTEADLAAGFLDHKGHRVSDLQIPVATGLEALLRLGIPVAIVSGSYTREIADVARAAGIPLRRFNPVLGSDRYHPWKPDPTGLLMAAAHHDVAPSRTWVLEDSATGLRAARAAGMRAIYADEFSFLGREKAAEYADVIVGTIGEVAGMASATLDAVDQQSR